MSSLERMREVEDLGELRRLDTAFHIRIAELASNRFLLQTVGNCFLTIDPGAFGTGFPERMDRLAAAVRAAPSAEPSSLVRMPGERRLRERAERQRAGVEVGEKLAAKLEALGVGGLR